MPAEDGEPDKTRLPEWLQVFLSSPVEAVRLHVYDDEPSELDGLSVKAFYWLFAPIAIAVQFLGILVLAAVEIVLGIGGAIRGGVSGAHQGWRKATRGTEKGDSDAS